MKIGIVTSWWNGAGAGEVSLNFSKVLLSSGNSVHVYARNEFALGKTLPIPFEHPNFSVTPAARSNSPLVKSLNIRHFFKFIARNEIDSVIFNEQVDLTPVIELKKLGIRCIAYVDYYREDTVNSFEIYDALICNTLRHFNVFKWHPNAWFLPWGIDPSLYKNTLAKASNNEFPFFHSCSYDPRRKGTDILLQSLAESDQLRCTIHAFPALSETLPEYEGVINKLKLQGRLQEINQLIRQPGLYSMGRIYVYPSRLEGIGLSILEAAASGLHLVIPDIEPFSEFALPFASTLVPIDTLRARSDAYYWPIAEVSSSSLVIAMKQALSSIQKNSDLHKRIQDSIFSTRNIYLTHGMLSSLIEELPFTPLQEEILDSAMNISSQKVPVLYSGTLKKLVFQIRQVMRRSAL